MLGLTSSESQRAGGQPGAVVTSIGGPSHAVGPTTAQAGAPTRPNAPPTVVGVPATASTPVTSTGAPTVARNGAPGGPIVPRSQPLAPVVGANGQVSSPGGQLRARTGTSSPATPSNLILGGVAGAFPSLDGAPAPSDARAPSPVSGLVVNQTPGMAGTAMGQNNVIAYDGSVVLVGDSGYLNANTGDAGQGGMVALEAAGSTFSSNHQSTGAGAAATGGAGWAQPVAAYPTGPLGPVTYPIGASGSGTATNTTAAWNPATGTSPSTPLRPGILAGGSPSEVPADMSPLASAFVSYTQNRTADIAGFEDHSVLTRGVGNVNTYDDSNVFIDRTGKLNANTGDTDSAGLNAVDSVRSTVSAGPHCDDGCDNESIITSQLGVFDEGDVAIDQHGNVVMPDVFDSDNVGAADGGNDEGDDSLASDTGDDTDAPADESPDGDIPDPVETREEADTTRVAADTTRVAADTTRVAADTTRVAADTTRQAADTGVDPVPQSAAGPVAAGDDEEDSDAGGGIGGDGIIPANSQAADGSLTVGGDGIDDLSARVDGTGNVETYDDSNVVIGGAGDVNAQIGDSDTGGTVTMQTVDSVAHGGNSR